MLDLMPAKVFNRLQDIQNIIAEKMPEGLIVSEHTDTAHFYRDTEIDKKAGSSSAIAGILNAPHLKLWAANTTADYVDEHFEELVSLKTMGMQEEVDLFYKRAVLAHDDKFKDAGGIGTIGHDFVDTYLKQWMEAGQRPDYSITSLIPQGTDVRAYAISRSAELFCNDFEAIPVASEMKVFSRKHIYGGTLDSIMFLKINGKYELCLVDWKTSNSINKIEYAMQTASYAQAFYEMTGIKVKYIVIVQLDKKYAKYTVLKVVNIPRAFKLFKHCNALFNELHDKGLSPLYPKEKISLLDTEYGSITEAEVSPV